MGFRFRKSVKIAPGVKLNLGKKSAGISVGGKLGGVSMNSRTGAQARVSAPGTGMSFTKKLKGFPKQNAEFTDSQSADASDYNEAGSGGGNHSGGPSRRKNILRWVLTIFMFLGALVFMPSVASVLMILFAVCCAPIAIIEDFLAERLHLAGKIKTAALAALFIVSVLVSPTTGTPSTPKSNAQQPAAQSIERVTPAASSTDKSAEVAASSADKIAESAAGSASAAASSAAKSMGETDAKSSSAPAAASNAEEQKATTQAPAVTDSEAPPKAATPAPAADTNEQTVYVTPTGKRYHFDPNCGNGDYSATTLSKAKAMGLTPCKKCAGG